MAKLTILRLPEELLQAILLNCRTWVHKTVKDKDAVSIDFGNYSDFHLRLDYAKYLPVLVTCKTFNRIASPLAYEGVRLVSPVLHTIQGRCTSFPEHYNLLPDERESGLFDTLFLQQRFITILCLSAQGIEQSRTILKCPSRPKFAENCRALSIDPRLPVTPSQTVVLPNVYFVETLANLTMVRLLDYTLASPSSRFGPFLVDWTSDDVVQWQLKFFRDAVVHLPQVKSLRLAFVGERLRQSVWDFLVESLFQYKELKVMCLSHMRSPSEQCGPHALPVNPVPDEVLLSPDRGAHFTTLILNDYGRCFQTLESLIWWPHRLEHFAFTLRFGFESLHVNDIHMHDSPMTSQILERLQTMLRPHQTTLKSLRIGFAMTQFAYEVAYMTGLDFPPGVIFGLDHSVIPDFRGYPNLQHLHIASIFAGHQDFHDRRRLMKHPSDLEELHQEVDRLLAPNLCRFTLDVGCEFALRHCPCFPLDPEDMPICNLLCPLDQDLFAYLITLAQHAKIKLARLRQIHINYCIRPFALSMPVSDLPEGFNWEWIPLYTDFDPWAWLEKVKRRVEKHGILLTYTVLEPVCGTPRTHLPEPQIPFNTSREESARLRREYDLQVFEYEDDMCSEHVWTVVKSG